MKTYFFVRVLVLTMPLMFFSLASAEDIATRQPGQSSSPSPSPLLAGSGTITNDTVTTEELSRQKLEAERRKTELEAQEIQQRLSESWYSPRFFVQALIGGAIAAGLLAAWAITYLLPILRKEREVAKLEAARLEAENKLQRFQLDQQQAELDRKTEAILIHEKQSEIELGRLVAENKSLVNQQERLREVLNEARANADRLAADYHALAEQKALSEQDRLRFEARARELEKRTPLLDSEREELRSAQQNAIARTEELDLRGKTQFAAGSTVKIIHTDARTPAAEHIAQFLQKYGVNTILSLTSDAGNGPHRGNVYYFNALQKRPAEQIAELLSSVEKLSVKESNLNLDTINIWVV